jgi:hypothetical protein
MSACATLAPIGRPTSAADFHHNKVRRRPMGARDWRRYSNHSVFSATVASRMSLLGFCQWLENTPGSIALHESLWGYPIVESVHVLTLCLFVGTAVILDLRLLGVTLRTVPVSEVAERLLPWTAAGFAVMVISGGLLFYAIPVRTYLNIFFRAKVVMLLLAGLNAWVFIPRSTAGWRNGIWTRSLRRGPGWPAACPCCCGRALWWHGE